MPQSRAAKHADERGRAHEQESKRNRGAISCAECRRLKLKCDKTVPCSSCTRRGCASICPNGSLTTGQGTRFILADTDRLHRKIIDMSERIRQLEDALAILQASTGSREPHPLLRRELLAIKSGIELHAASSSGAGSSSDPPSSGTKTEEEHVLDVFGTLAVRDDGGATFFGSSAGQESLLLEERLEPLEPESPRAPRPPPEPLPVVVDRLNASFPAGPADVDLQDLEVYLPPWPRAGQLCDLYLEQAPWFFGPVTRRQLLDEVLPLFYHEAASGGSLNEPNTPPRPETSAPAVKFQLPREEGEGGATAHDLALLFVVFCFGALTDPVMPPAPHNTEASRYFSVTKAALNLVPVLDGNPSVATVQTLSLMGIYQGMVSDENSIEITWAYMGLSCRLAQSVGLHRDCARWKLTPSEVQKRRALFWELFITDGFQSLATGRLPIFSLPFVDTELAADPDETLAEDGTKQLSFPAWKARFGRECIAPVVQVTTKARAPKYSVILELDRKIRDMELPKYATGSRPEGAGLSKTMAFYMPQNYRELTLTYVHRCYFAQALRDFPQDPLRSPYAPSFLAGYRSACALLTSMREQFELFPAQLARFWVLWTHAFSATVILASVVTHGGITKTAQAAMGELRLSLDLFERTSRHGGRAIKFLPIIRRLHDKAYNSINEGFKLQKDIFSPRDGDDAKQDELSIFGGRTHTVRTKSGKSRKLSTRRRHASAPTSASSSGVPSPPESSTSESPVVSPTSSQEQQTNPAVPAPSYYHSLETYGNSVHPMLVDQMRSFEGQLDAQINNAAQYYATPKSTSSKAHTPDSSVLPPSAATTLAPTPGISPHGATRGFVQEWPIPGPSSSVRPVVPAPSVEGKYPSPEQSQSTSPSQQPFATQTMLFNDNQHQHHQQQPFAHDIPMYGGVESSIPPGMAMSEDHLRTPLASSSQDQTQYTEYPTSISHPSSQEYTRYEQPHQAYTQNWNPLSNPQASQSGDILMYPQENESYKMGAVGTTDFGQHPYQTHTANLSINTQGQYQYYVSQPQQHAPFDPNLPQYHPQYHQSGMIPQVPPTPTESYLSQPRAGVLPVHAGVPYSLQDAWTSFMQHELPVPPSLNGSHRGSFASVGSGSGGHAGMDQSMHAQ